MVLGGGVRTKKDSKALMRSQAISSCCSEGDPAAWDNLSQGRSGKELPRKQRHYFRWRSWAAAARAGKGSRPPLSRVGLHIWPPHLGGGAAGRSESSPTGKLGPQMIRAGSGPSELPEAGDAGGRNFSTSSG